MSYVTIAEVRAVAQGMTTSGVPAAPDSFVTDLIDRASRMFDHYCGVTEGYFEANGGSSSARVFYGDGTNYLRLDAYVAGSLNPTITMPTGYTVPEFSEGNGYLIRASNGVRPPGFLCTLGWPWPAGVPVTVTAKWGFSATPSDVKQAIVEWVINLWRETDPATTKLVGLDGATLRESIPPRVEEIANQRAMNVAQFI